jgi:NadR type nicotinamide-nucleotide adenylyltransferase
VIIINYLNPEFDRCTAANRKMWFESAWPAANHPELSVLVIDPNVTSFPITSLYSIKVPRDDDPEIDHRDFCANILLYHFGTSVDAVFSSESYGDGFARYLTNFFHTEIGSDRVVKHECVDMSRTRYQISGTVLRTNHQLMDKYLSADVRASFVKRLVIYGGESSGKTTLAIALAKHFSSEVVLEFGREFTERIGGVKNLRYEDMETIARTQLKLEHNTARVQDLNHPLICDTSPLTTYFYSLELFGMVSAQLSAFRQQSFTQYDYTVLCSPDIPFEQDGDRISEGFRNQGHSFYKFDLKDHGVPHITVHGTVEERVQQVLEYIRSRNSDSL